MVKSPYPADLPVTSSEEIERTARQLKAVREEFLTAGTELKHPPRPVILNSWQRCSALQVDPSLLCAPLAIADEAELQDARADSHLLLRAARPVMRYLADMVADAGYVVALSNARGCLLEIIGNAHTRRRLSLVDFVPGADWSEAAAGTNALGTAIIDGRVIQLLGAEHYCAGWQDITCTAAPIRHPLTGEIMGILDITGNYRLIRPFLSYCIAAMALQIQYEVHALITRPYKRPCWAYTHTLPARSTRRSQPSRLTRNTELQRLQAYTAYMTTAISNARQLAASWQRTRRIEVLSTLAHLLSSATNPSDHLTEVLKYMIEIMGMDTGMALFYDRHTNHLQIAAHWGLPTSIAPDLYARLSRPLYTLLPTMMGKPATYCGLQSKEQNVRTFLNSISCCDMLVTPLSSSSTRQGILLFGSHMHHTLNQEDMALSTLIGQLLGMQLAGSQLCYSSNQTDVLHEADLFRNSFFVAVSHDLQSPLAAIRASAESLLQQKAMQLSHEQEHLLHTIVGQASRLDQLVDQLLDLARIEAGVFALDQDWLNPHVLITDTATRFAELYRGYQVELDLTANTPLLYIDPDRFVQVLWNLLENARKYASSPVIKIDSQWQDNNLLIGVADRCAGIPAEEREKIFQHFYRLPKDQRGTAQGSGLGLAICRGIIEAHGGRIWVEDRPEGGCIFRFTLPLPLHATELSDNAWEVL
jgi:signal transduction histidine kinase